MKEGWTYNKLGDICKLYQPHTISSKEMVDDGKYDVFGANGIIGKYNQYNHEEPEILMTCRGATCGNINVSTPKSWINGNAMVVHIKDEKTLNKSFLIYVLSHIDKTHIITGAAQPQITRQTLSPLMIGYPTLAEQERIVERLDAAFEQIDELKSNAERQLAEARALFQSALTQAMQPKPGWQEKKLKEIGLTQTGTTPSKSDKSNYGDFIPFIRPSEIDFDGCGNINYDCEMKLSDKGLSMGRLFKKHSVLMVCIGATISKVGFSSQDISCNQQINVLYPSDEYHYKYIYYAMRNDDFKRKVIKEGTSAQATLPIINKSKWENLTLFVPDIDEQQRISNHLDSLSSNVLKLEEISRKTAAECDALKQALLRQIFE